MKVEKRVPFGFRGDWGKLYKKFTNNENLEFDEKTIKVENFFYREIDSLIQLKRVGDLNSDKIDTADTINKSMDIINVETTDSYWDEEFKDYLSCVQRDDVIFAFDKFWKVKNVRQVTKFRLKGLNFYYCELKSVENVKMRGGCDKN